MAARKGNNVAPRSWDPVRGTRFRGGTVPALWRFHSVAAFQLHKPLATAAAVLAEGGRAGPHAVRALGWDDFAALGA